MRKILFTTAIFLLPLILKAQLLNWAYQFKSGEIQDQVYDVSSNGTDKFAVLGFGASNVDAKNLSPQFNVSGRYLAVFDESANVLWRHSVYMLSLGIKMHTTSDVYVTGNFSGTVDFDPTAGVFNLTGEGTNCFLQKFDASGNFVWASAAKIGGGGSEIEVMSKGNIIV